MPDNQSLELFVNSGILQSPGLDVHELESVWGIQ